MNFPIPIERIERRIYLIRGRKVMLDRHLAEFYRVATYNLNKTVKRNLKRFPENFMFQLSREEYAALRFQIGILKRGQHSKYLPYAFTEHGILMLANVLRSQGAFQASVAIIETFVRSREAAVVQNEFTRKLAELEGRVGRQEARIESVFEEIRGWMAPPEKPAKKIGFQP